MGSWERLDTQIQTGKPRLSPVRSCAHLCQILLLLLPLLGDHLNLTSCSLTTLAYEHKGKETKAAIRCLYAGTFHVGGGEYYVTAKHRAGAGKKCSALSTFLLSTKRGCNSQVLGVGFWFVTSLLHSTLRWKDELLTALTCPPLRWPGLDAQFWNQPPSCLVLRRIASSS